ncbi:MAG: OprO/OprP family phosphate-selective porin, partial [Planctomycetaceae bacterium]
TTYPTIGVTGFFQGDGVWFHQDSDSLQSLGDIPDIVDFRRARLAAKGQVAENVAYMLEMDFAFPGRPTFMDVFVELQDPDFVSFRFGQWRQPFGMDAMSSARDLWFLERALPFAFLPFRQTGIGAFSTEFDDAVTWAVSGYKFPADPFGGNFGDKGYGMSTRITWNPIYEEVCHEVVHFGFGYSLNEPSSGRIRYRSTPEVGFTLGDFNGNAVAVPFFVDTGLLNMNWMNLLGLEFAAARGPWSFQSEFLYVLADQAAAPNLAFPGAYAQVAYVLTGEHHSYNRKQGVFGRVVPKNNWGKCGCGAWELAGRWSYIDLDDANVNGGTLHDLTFGLNWYLNKFTKFQFNYIHAMLDHSLQQDSGTDILAVRAQLDF